jgi:hypothetical protein
MVDQAQERDSFRWLDEAEPGMKIADVLPDDMRSETLESDPGYQVTPCCETRIRYPDLYRQNVKRYREDGVCLGTIPDGGLTLVKGDPLTVLVDGEGPPLVEHDPDQTPPIVDEAGWWTTPTGGRR